MEQLSKSLCYCTNLRRSANIITSFYDSMLSETGLSVAQYYLLINLSRKGSANITHWAEMVGLDRSTMVRNIKSLQNHNLVEIVEGHGKTFTLSSKGQQTLNKAIPLWKEAQSQIESLLGKENIEILFQISDKLQDFNWKSTQK